MIKKSLTAISIISILMFSTCKTTSDQEWDNNDTQVEEFSSLEKKTLNDHILQKKPNILSVLVLHNDNLIFEEYYNNRNKNTKFLICSATKTVTSMLIGIAIDNGHLTDLNKPFTSYFPEYSEYIQYQTINQITVEHLLSMTDGFRWDDRSYFSKEVKKNAVKHAFSLYPEIEPGKTFRYNSLDSQLLSAILRKTTGMTAEKYANEFLFNHLQINKYRWVKDMQGDNAGATGLYLRSRDMVKIGKLLCNYGDYDGTQVISKSWIEKMSTLRTDGGPPHNAGYGYHCWITVVNGYDAFFAGGYGGQFIYVVPELDLVVIITSKLDRHREHHRTIIGEYIIPLISNVN